MPRTTRRRRSRSGTGMGPRRLARPVEFSAPSGQAGPIPTEILSAVTLAIGEARITAPRPPHAPQLRSTGAYRSPDRPSAARARAGFPLGCATRPDSEFRCRPAAQGCSLLRRPDPGSPSFVGYASRRPPGLSARPDAGSPRRTQLDDAIQSQPGAGLECSLDLRQSNLAVTASCSALALDRSGDTQECGTL